MPARVKPDVRPDSRKALTATLIGYHGYGNLGDDIFRDALLRWMGEELGVRRCFVATRNASAPYRSHGVSVVPFSNWIPSIARAAWGGMLLAALRSDIVIFGSGSIFTVQPFRLMFFTLKLFKALRGKAGKIVALGVSIGPFRDESSRSWCLRSLALMDEVLVRDSSSMHALAHIQSDTRIVRSFDLALSTGAVPTVGQRAPGEDGPIGICMTERGFGHCDDGHSSICNALINALMSAHALHPAVKARLFCLCTDARDGDAEVVEHLAHRLRGLRLPYEVFEYRPGDIAAASLAIAQCRAMIAARLHGGVVSMLHGIPLYQIAYGAKTNELFAGSGLSRQFLLSCDQAVEGSMTRFLDAALSGTLAAAGASQRLSLLRDGSMLDTHMKELAGRIRSERVGVR